MTTQNESSMLDLSAPAASPTDVTEKPDGQPQEVLNDLVLTPPAPVAAVPTSQASAMMPLEAEAAQELASRARGFVEALADSDPRDPVFGEKIRDVVTMGDKDIRNASAVSNRMMQRPVKALEAARGGGEGADATRAVANGLVDLRQTVEDLDPSKMGSFEPKKLLGIIPFGKNVRDYFDKYQTSQQHLDKIIVSLKNGQDELRKDNAAIEGEKANLWNTMKRMQEYAVLAEAIDSALEEKIEDIRITDPERADGMKSDLLFAVRQKHQDLLTQLAVSAQGYLALDMIRRNNLELIKGVDRATTTTVAALRTAITVAQALANQKLVLDQITALNTTTSNLIVATSQMLRSQTAQVHEQAAAATVSVESLKEAFANIYATMDAIDTFKAQATDNMSVTVTELQEQITKANHYLERAQQKELTLPGDKA